MSAPRTLRAAFVRETLDTSAHVVGLGLALAGIALIAYAAPAHSAESHVVTVECHDSVKSFVVAKAATFGGARDFAARYWDEERDSAAAFCRPHSFEIIAK